MICADGYTLQGFTSLHVQDAPGHVRRTLARPYGAWKVAWRHFQHGKTKWVLERLRPRAIASHQLVPHSSEKAATAVLRHENSPAATAPSQVHGLGVKAGHEGRNMSDVRLHWEACVWQRVALKRHELALNTLQFAASDQWAG